MVKFMNKDEYKNENEDLASFFSILKDSAPHADRESLKTLLSSLPVTEETSVRYESRENTGIVSPFIRKFNNGLIGFVRSPFVLSTVGVMGLFIVFVTTGVATTNQDITRVVDKNYSLTQDIAFSTRNSLRESDANFVSNELSNYPEYSSTEEVDTELVKILTEDDAKLLELSNITYEI